MITEVELNVCADACCVENNSASKLNNGYDRLSFTYSVVLVLLVCILKFKNQYLV